MRTSRAAARLVWYGIASGAVCVLLAAGCPPQDTSGDPNTTPDASQNAPNAWAKAFDFAQVGALSGVWGSGPNDVFIVGGNTQQGEIYHYNGSVWQAQRVPAVPLLVWVYGFGPNNVYTVGTKGGVLHYDGSSWRQLDPGTTEDLWGIWGRSPTDMWIVGGTVGSGAPVLLHFDGQTFTPTEIPSNDRSATALFKVWGIGSKLFAVGERGLILSYDGQAWSQVPAGADADEDFVSLWGTSDDHIVAVGGRSSGRIARYDGASWTTERRTGVPGLSAVCVGAANEAIVGGQNGYVARYNPMDDSLTEESVDSTQAIHAAWYDGAGHYYVVGGRFAPPYAGVAFVRSPGGALGQAGPPLAVTGGNSSDGPALVDCNDNGMADAQDIAGGTSADCDGNGVPDECQPDSDGDGVPDVCDACPGADDDLDDDNDSVPNGCDICPGFPDGVDSDGDGIPNGCDDCAGDNSVDSDGDGVPDDCDVCPGHDDNVDVDGDGIPDGCCDDPSDCPLGSNCNGSGVCEATSDPDIELGIGGGTFAYARLRGGEDWILYKGPQGYVDGYPTMRVVGFTAGADVEVFVQITCVDCAGGSQLIAQSTDVRTLNAVGSEPGVAQVAEFWVILFAAPETVNGRTLEVSATVTDFNNPAITATVELTFIADVREP